MVNWFSSLAQKGGFGEKDCEKSLAERTLHSSLKLGREIPPTDGGRIEVWKAGWVLEEFQIKLLMMVWMDLIKWGGGGQIGT